MIIKVAALHTRGMTGEGGGVIRVTNLLPTTFTFISSSPCDHSFTLWLHLNCCKDGSFVFCLLEIFFQIAKVGHN